MVGVTSGGLRPRVACRADGKLLGNGRSDSPGWSYGPTSNPSGAPHTKRAVSVFNVGLIVHEVSAATKVVSVVLKVPAAVLDECAVISTEASTDRFELIEISQPFPTLLRVRAVGVVQNTGRQLMDGIFEQSEEIAVALLQILVGHIEVFSR